LLRARHPPLGFGWRGVPNQPDPKASTMATTFKSDFLATLSDRGFIHQCSDFDALDSSAAKGKVIGYVGYDCTAPSLHIGNFISMMMLHWLQATGNKPIALMGGGTTRIGDPSGKDESRALRSVEEIDANKAGIKGVFAQVLKFGDGPTATCDPPHSGAAGRIKHDAVMIDNADWLVELKWIDMLREVGRHFSVNRMLTMDSVKLRLEREQEMSFIEFNYMVAQSYDFVELAKRTGCNLQMGGSDQWGNIVNGCDLGRRMGLKHQLFALTTPLLTTASGAKMGKTAQGAVWLNETQMSAYDFWQYWRNCEDADVGKLLGLFTVLPMAEVRRLAALTGNDINEAKKVLATEATALIHGRAKADAAAETARQTFEQGTVAADLPTVGIPHAVLAEGISVLQAFVMAELVKSNSEARRQIQAGGLKVNDQQVTDDQRDVTLADVTADGVIKLSFGKKRHVLLKPKG
jgi:tyrosyl-tRNA synthetase